MSIFGFLLGKQYNVLAYLPEAVLVIDETGRIRYANKSAQKLFETARIKGKNINDFFIINSENIIKNKDEEVKQILKIVTEEQNTKITDVKVTDVSSKKRKRYILTIIDNTQDHSLLNQLIAEKQTQKILNHTKNMLLSKMDNYLTSPLHSVVGFSQAMLSGLSGDLNEKQRKYLEIMNSNSAELLLFIQKLVELSQIEADLYKFDFNNFDITVLLSVVLNEFKVKLLHKDIKLSVNTSDLFSSACYSDKNVIRIILTNMLENAAELIETGAINITLSNPLPEFLITKGFDIDNNISEKSYLMVEVACKGLDGSLYNNIDIFDPYVQADKNNKKYLLQSFLLGSSQKFANKLRGEMWISNQYANQVSFMFIVPADKAPVEV